MGYSFVEHTVDSPYYQGYDIWLALTILCLSPEKILEAFPAYRPKEMTANNCISNLQSKLADKQFTADISNLTRHDAPEYDVNAAGEYVTRELLSKL